MVTLAYLYSCHLGDFSCRRPKQLPTHATNTASTGGGSGRIAGKYPTTDDQLSAPRNKLVFQVFVKLSSHPHRAPITSPRRRMSNRNGSHIRDSQNPLLTHIVIAPRHFLKDNDDGTCFGGRARIKKALSSCLLLALQSKKSS